MSTAACEALPAAPRIHFLGVLQAELERSRHTFTWRSALVTVLLAAWAITLSRGLLSAGLVLDDDRWAGNILGWLSFYPNAVALPAGTLVGAMHEWREQRIRGGGTLWRSAPPALVLVARCLVIAASALLSQVGWLVPVLVFAQMSGSGWGPVDSYLVFAALMWLSVTGAGLLGLAATRLMGPVAVGLVPAGAFVWSTLGAFQAESPSWLLLPWTWVVRATLPLLGVHGNSVNLEPGAAAWDYPVWPGLLLSTVSTLALTALVLVTAPLQRPCLPRGHRRRHIAPEQAMALVPERSLPAVAAVTVFPPTAASGRRSALLALAGALPWRLWAVLWLPLAGVVAATRAAYSSDAAVALLALVGLPVAGAVVGITTRTWLRSAWRGVLLRVPEWQAVPAALLGGWLFLTGALSAAWVVAAGGTEPERGGLAGPEYVALVAPWVAAGLAALSYLVTQATSVATAIAASVGGLLAGLVIAGNDVIAEGPLIWLTAPWGWSYVAGTHPARWVLIVGLGALTALVSTLLAALQTRRAARAPD